ncbi:ATP11 protein [Trichoderma simmonsii]|uniref:ATP11 protein n=1 Tax=Trichoderma simmonsii TaxID=1491479 RepID=A0A8G0LFX1_9HYPO|nr:ATP11 protein [Trichoderma simmonsii]
MTEESRARYFKFLCFGPAFATANSSFINLFVVAMIRIPTLRHLATNSARFAARTTQQRRWAQVVDVRFHTTQPSQVILEKYRDKLVKKASQEGHGSIEDLKAAYADKIQEQRKNDAVDVPSIEDLSSASIPQTEGTPVSQPNRGPVPSSSPKPASKASSGEKPAIKPLGDILDLEKAADLPEKELTAIWRLRHASSPQTLCAVIPAPTYKAMEDLARSSPFFVLPVPHEDQGAEMHLLQWTFDAASKTSTVLFTQLVEYKTRGEFAQPHTTVTHHLDLINDKGLVLMQGQVMEGRGVQPDHARWLVMCLQRFYGGWEQKGDELDGQRKERAEERKKLLEWFTKGDPRFSVEKLLEEAERLG